MIKIANLNTWKTKTEAAKKRVRLSATKHVQNAVRKVYKEALRVSPQFSGNMTFNWAIETSTNKPSYSARFKPADWRTVRVADRRQAGDLTAINAALSAEEDIIQQLKWNHNISLVNTSPQAQLIEDGLVKLRPENLVTGGLGVKAYLKAKYRYLT